MNNTHLRMIAWREMFLKHSELFDSFFGNMSQKNKSALWESYLFDYFERKYTDNEIISTINSKNFNLLSIDDNEKLASLYFKMLDYIKSKYDSFDINLLTSLDDVYPDIFKKVLRNNLENNSNQIQYIPNIFVYNGSIGLLRKETKKLAIIGTRESKDIIETKREVSRIHVKYPSAICVTGLASGVDTMGVLEFEESICFIGEELLTFIKRNQKDTDRRQAKEKVMNKGLILSHKLPHESMSQFDFRTALLERNLFVVLLSESIHPIEFGIKSGTISAINHAIKNNKPIFTPSSLITEDVKKKYSENIKFY